MALQELRTPFARKHFVLIAICGLLAAPFSCYVPQVLMGTHGPIHALIICTAEGAQLVDTQSGLPIDDPALQAAADKHNGGLTACCNVGCGKCPTRTVASALLLALAIMGAFIGRVSWVTPLIARTQASGDSCRARAPPVFAS